MVRVSKSQGFRVDFVLHSRRLKKGSTWDQQQITIGSPEIISDWDRLLSLPGVAEELRNNVDIFTPISELEKMHGGSAEFITWPEAKELETRAALLIRKKVLFSATPL